MRTVVPLERDAAVDEPANCEANTNLGVGIIFGDFYVEGSRIEGDQYPDTILPHVCSCFVV